MNLNEDKIISTEDIEILNAHGPYSMAVWTSGNVAVGNEEGLRGRSAYFTQLIRKALLENFSLDELSTFSILDVGCNDGWVLHELSDLPFSKMVGVEPREKNIKKGEVVRKVLKLKNRVEYRCGDIESLNGEIFDVVICAGVLYHVESIPLALRQLRDSCKKFLFIESRCLSSSLISKKLKDQIEMRDLVYQFKKKHVGITAQKFESAYHDGSARRTTIVNIPTTESLLMSLESLGFNDLKVVANTKDYRDSVWKNRRPLDGVCITAMVNQCNKDDCLNEKDWIMKYEYGLRNTILKRSLMQPLYKFFLQNKFSVDCFGKSIFVLLYILSPAVFSNALLKIMSFLSYGEYELEILKNLRYAPKDKIALEFGKILESEGKSSEALTVLKQISSKINADWRSVYRSYFLISKIYGSQKEYGKRDRYLSLCLTCNPKYPMSEEI